MGWAFLNRAAGELRLYSVPLPEGSKNLWQMPNLLLQKLPAEEFRATTKLTFTPRFEGEKAGLVMMGLDYATLTLTNTSGRLLLTQTVCQDADKLRPELSTAPDAVPANQPIYLRATVRKGARCQFSYSPDGRQFTPVGPEFQAREGKWIGAKIGLFCTRPGVTNDAGTADVDWFRVEAVNE